MSILWEAVAENFVWAVIGTCFIVGLLMRAVIVVAGTLARERSRREIAAYIAEGSISAEQGERLMRASISSGASTI